MQLRYFTIRFLVVAQILGTPLAFPDDRKENQEGASAAAIAAAASQGAMCLLMMEKAKESGDPMMEMMAMQQCMQAAKSAENGKQNSDNAKKLTDNTPKTDTKDDFKLDELKPPAEEEEKTAELPKTDAPSFQLPDYSSLLTKKDEATAPKEAEEKKTQKEVVQAVSIPNLVDQTSLGYDESKKESQNPTPSRVFSPGSVIATAPPGSGSTPSPLDGAAKSATATKNKRAIGVNGETLDTAESGGGSAGKSAEGGKSDNGSLDAMMALLKPPGADAGMMMGAGPEIWIPPSGDNAATGRTWTIFDMASIQYQSLSKDAQISKKQAAPKRSISSLR